MTIFVRTAEIRWLGTAAQVADQRRLARETAERVASGTDSVPISVRPKCYGLTPRRTL